jgi:pimeloyl-ACP methyl ester carboxylesterase
VNESIWHETPHGMHYCRLGRGRPVVLLHGWCLNSSMWTYTEELLGADYDVIIPDLAGFGRSADMNGPYRLERYAEDIADLLKALNLKDAVLVGFALGAAVAMAAAGLSNDRIGQVISIGMPDPTASPYDRMPKSMRRDWPDFARRSAEALFLKVKSPATVSWIERIFGSASLRVAIQACSLLQSLDAPALASAAKVSQIYIHSTTDTVAPVAFGEKCVAAASRGEISIIEGCGHLIVLDDRESFHKILLAHIDARPA